MMIIVKFTKKILNLFILICLFLQTNCSSSSDLLKRITITEKQLAAKEKQSRSYHNNIIDICHAVMNVLQDQHYTIREVDVNLGIIYADQTNDLGMAFQIFGIPILGFGSFNYFGIGFDFNDPFSLIGPTSRVPYVDKQVGSASVIIYPDAISKNNIVHLVIAARSFYNTGELAQVWRINNPRIYQSFFNEIDKALYLQKAQFK